MKGKQAVEALSALAQAGLVVARKQSRFRFYSANFDRMNELVSFLTEHCCILTSDCASATCAPSKSAITHQSVI